MARKSKKKSQGTTGQEWLATYSDTITLLLTFFILLYSFSSVDAKKLKAVSDAFQVIMKGEAGGSVLDFPGSQTNVPIDGKDKIDPTQDLIDKKEQAMKAQAQKVHKEVEKFLSDNGLKDAVDLEFDKRGTVMHLKGNVFFNTARADLTEEAIPMMDKVNELLTKLGNYPVVIEGHTDNRPIHNNNYASNWELSTSRAVNVLKYFVDTKGQKADRFSAAGYGEYKPLVPNDSEENMAKNRRVNIVIVTIKGQNS